MYGGAGQDQLFGGHGADQLIGDVGNDELYGEDGNDLMFGDSEFLPAQAGEDTLDGGEGSDIYLYADTAHLDANEVINDTGTAGTDEIRFASTLAGTTLTLNANTHGIERVVIGTGTAAKAVTSGKANVHIDASAATEGMSFLGNAGNNSITGGAGDDTLDGGAGSDTLQGGAGNDTYIVDSLVEAAAIVDSDGIDTLQLKINTAGSYTLAADIENVTLTGTGNISLTGNASDNILTGNAAANTLIGEDGDDHLIGNAGNDTLNGGAGNDTLDGGSGNDVLLNGEVQFQGLPTMALEPGF